jgi:hypothetical protein
MSNIIHSPGKKHVSQQYLVSWPTYLVSWPTYLLSSSMFQNISHTNYIPCTYRPILLLLLLYVQYFYLNKNISGT